MRILILGSRGMLGSMVEKYFSKNHDLIIINDRFMIDQRLEYLNKIRSVNPEILINCIGKIKQKDSSIKDLLISNSILPLEISSFIPESCLYVHPSTDCVFKGDLKGKYSHDSHPDADDEYGLSKIYGELAASQAKNHIILRGSIIGCSPEHGKGLLDWFLGIPDGDKVHGYSNHIWNGVTTLEWCKILQKILDGDLSVHNGLIQIGTEETINKYELLKTFNKFFQKNVTIEKYEHPELTNRALESDIAIPLNAQLEEFRLFLTKNFKDKKS